jgi:hypothetical protein
MSGRRSPRPVVQQWLRLGSLLLLIGLVGCFSKAAKVIPLTNSETNLKNIVLAYMDAHEQLHHPPKSAEELKPFLKRFGDPDQILVSPSDGQPYVVVWGADLSRGGPTPYQQMFPIFAYEKKGSDGRRAIVDTRGRPLTIPEEDLPKLTFVAGHKPSPS